MKFFYDTEFLEDGKTIDLISIAIVAADNRHYYAINIDCDWDRVVNDEWLRNNVIPTLPIHVFQRPVDGRYGWEWKPHAYELLRHRRQIAPQIVEFVGEKPEFWAYYADYDWVALCQLYGRMIDLPPGWPMYCRDLKQLADEHSIVLPQQETTEHNALGDAFWVKKAYEHVMEAR